MDTVLLFRGDGNWLPFLFILVAIFLVIKGVEWLVRRFIHWLHHRRHIHHMNHHAE